MAASVLPLTKALDCCDDVVGDPESGKIHLFGISNAVRPPPGSSYPFRLGRLCVFAQLVGGLGETSLRVELVNAQRGTTVYSSRDRRVRFADRRTMLYVCFRILECPFREPGEYVIALYAQNVFLEDRPLLLLA